MSDHDPILPVVAKQQLVCDTLRKQIVSGEYPPGSRLPTQVQLVEQFRVSGVTIQRSLDRLMREGFICTRGRNGTFVTENPPHLSNFGLVFVDQPRRGQHRSRYHEMLESQAFRLQREGGRRVTVFNGVSGREDEEATQQLLADVRAHRMAGLMLVDPDTIEGTAILDEQGIPRVAVMSRKIDPPGCPIVFPDMAGMIDIGLDTLIAQKRSKIAVMVTVPVYHECGAHLRHAIKRRPVTVHERWIQITPHDMPEAVRNATLLLMDSSNAQRPDGILILDDNLAEGVSTGLVNAGMRVPMDVSVVAHCNFPWSAPSVLPVTRVGFDTQQILDRALQIIDLQRQGRAAPQVTTIPAVVKDSSQRDW